jgi:hypothetical protein
MESVSDMRVSSLHLAMPCFEQVCAVNQLLSSNRSSRIENEVQNSEMLARDPVISNKIKQIDIQENTRHGSHRNADKSYHNCGKNYPDEIIEVRDEVIEEDEEAENSRILAKLLNEIDCKVCTCITARLFPHWAISCGGQKMFAKSSGLGKIVSSAVALTQTRIEKNVLGQDSISIERGHLNDTTYGYDDGGEGLAFTTKKATAVMQGEIWGSHGTQDTNKILRPTPTDSSGRITFIELQSQVTTEMSKLKVEETTFNTKWPIASQVTSPISSPCTDTVLSSSSKPDRYDILHQRLLLTRFYKIIFVCHYFFTYICKNSKFLKPPFD